MHLCEIPGQPNDVLVGPSQGVGAHQGHLARAQRDVTTTPSNSVQNRVHRHRHVGELESLHEVSRQLQKKRSDQETAIEVSSPVASGVKIIILQNLKANLKAFKIARVLLSFFFGHCTYLL